MKSFLKKISCYTFLRLFVAVIVLYLCPCTISHNLYGRNYLCSFYLINSFSRNIELTCPNLLKTGQSHMTNSGHWAVNRINICHSVHVFHMVNLKYDRTLIHHSPRICLPTNVKHVAWTRDGIVLYQVTEI